MYIIEKTNIVERAQKILLSSQTELNENFVVCQYDLLSTDPVNNLAWVAVLGEYWKLKTGFFWVILLALQKETLFHFQSLEEGRISGIPEIYNWVIC